MDQADTRQAWLDEEKAVRARLSAYGVASREELAGQDGIDFLNRIGSGELPPPPIGQTLDFVPISAQRGQAVFQGTPGPQHLNPSGAVHGGYIATLLDSAVGCAIHSMLPAGKGYTTLELKINYLRGLTEKTGPVRAEGKIVTVGNQVAVAEGRLTDAGGKLYAIATTTCLVFPIAS